MPTMTIRAVFFDVGETLVNESRQWAAWADHLGVPAFALFATLGAVIERREHHRRVFERLRPGFDLAEARAERDRTGRPDVFTRDDLYPDVMAGLRALKARGYVVGISGNQPARTEEVLRGLGVPVDVVASSATWGVEKPDVRFFERVAVESGFSAREVAYVGDRVDNDVLPARAAGLLSVLIRRGPWGYVQADWPEAELADVRVESLLDLPRALSER